MLRRHGGARDRLLFPVGVAPRRFPAREQTPPSGLALASGRGWAGLGCGRHRFAFPLATKWGLEPLGEGSSPRDGVTEQTPAWGVWFQSQAWTARDERARRLWECLLHFHKVHKVLSREQGEASTRSQSPGAPGEEPPTPSHGWPAQVSLAWRRPSPEPQ